VPNGCNEESENYECFNYAIFRTKNQFGAWSDWKMVNMYTWKYVPCESKEHGQELAEKEMLALIMPFLKEI